MKTNLQGSTHNIPDSIWWLFAFAGLFRCLLTSIAPYSTCSISYLNEYVMMSSITTKQPVRMPLIYSTACKQWVKAKKPSERHLLRSLTAAGKYVYFWAFSPLFFLSLFLPFSQQQDTGWTSAGCHGYWKGNVSHDQEGKQKQAVAPPPCNVTGLQRKSSLWRHNGRLEEVGVAIWG